IGWDRPFTAVLEANRQTTPAAIWERTRSLASAIAEEDREPVGESVQALCFARPLEPREREHVEARIVELAASLHAKNVLRFSRVLCPAWLNHHTFTWTTPYVFNTEDRSGGAEWSAMLTDLRLELPILAYNGRAC